MSSDAENQPIDKNASEALQKYRDMVRVLVERPAGQPLPSEAKSSLEALDQYDLLVGKYAGLLPVLELPSNAGFGETALLGALALQAGRIKVAAHIYEEVNFGTSNVTALAYVMQGVGAFLAITVLLFLLSCLMLLVVDATVIRQRSSWKPILDECREFWPGNHPNGHVAIQSPPGVRCRRRCAGTRPQFGRPGHRQGDRR